jgi:NAD(P)-dependent dehydrogenase (short-subunit alcohol dehydrogenase family)
MKKQHSLIIGGTRGIGRALTKLLAVNGHVVSVIGRRPPTESDKDLPNVRHWVADLLDKAQLEAALSEVLQMNGKLNSLAFLQRYRGQGDNWAGEIETSLTATKQIIERLANEFDGDGGIVLVSSIIGQFVVSGQPVSYHVAKAGIDHMVRYYAVMLGPKGIRVNGVSPASIIKEESREFYLKNEKLLDLFKKIVPLGRIGTAEEVAQVIAFLCSPQASLVTGQNIVADGGMTLQSQESLTRSLTAL